MSKRFLFPALLVVLGFGVYAWAISSAFVFDDKNEIVGNEKIRDLWAMHRGNRPVLMFSLALNYAISGLQVEAYRFTNILIHVIGALFLYGIVRRTLRGPRFGDRFDAAAADGVGFAVAGLWIVHPLQTMAVTYVWQRAESMMGMFFLMTLYCVVRHAEGRRQAAWTAGALVAFFLGLGTKEVMAAVVPLALIFDSLLLSPSLRDALRRRRVLYGVFGLVLLVGVVFVLPNTSTAFAGHKSNRWGYLASQPGILLEYIGLALWPNPLCFDYGHVKADTLRVVLPGLVVVAGLVATAWGLWKRAWWSVLGAWFFLILAPTSSFFPINDRMVEYRMYLPLVAVLVPVVIGVRALCTNLNMATKIPLVVGLVALGALTIDRNRVYESRETLWQSVLEVRPRNVRAIDTIAELRTTEYEKLEQLIAKNPDAPNRARLEQMRDLRAQQIMELSQRTIDIFPTPFAHRRIALLLVKKNDFEGAVKHMQDAHALAERNLETLMQLSEMLSMVGQTDECIEKFEKAIQLNSELRPRQRQTVQIYQGFARSMYRLQQRAKGIEVSRAALELEGVKRNEGLKREFQTWVQQFQAL